LKSKTNCIQNETLIVVKDLVSISSSRTEWQVTSDDGFSVSHKTFVSVPGKLLASKQQEKKSMQKKKTMHGKKITKSQSIYS
jgi:hypothetical protein